MAEETSAAATVAPAPGRIDALAQHAARLVTSTWALGALIGLASWAPNTIFLSPTSGFDASWVIGIHMATAHGLDFGRDIVFTYGPLGFLEEPLLIYPGLAILAVVYALVVFLALGTSLLWAARRSFPLWIAFPLSLLAGMLIGGPGGGYPALVVVLLWCIVAVAGTGPERARRVLPFAGGFAAALLLLLKLNIGAAVLAICAIAVLTMEPARRLRNLGAFAVTFAGSFLVLWLATGQNVGAIPDFLRYSRSIVTGYSTALALETVENPLAYALAALGLLFVALVVAYVRSRGLTSWRRWAVVAMVALAAFFVWKAAFVRHETVRAIVVPEVPLAVAFAFVWRGWGRFLAVGLVAATAAVYFPLTGLSVRSVLRPIQGLEDAVYEVRAVLDPSERREILTQAREQMQTFYGLDARTQSMLRGHRVDVEPSEIGLVWAYDLQWSPAPVFQSLSAYTSDLDELNAARLNSPSGPDRILLHAPSFSFGVGSDYFQSLAWSQRHDLGLSNHVSVDGRFLTYQQPAAYLAMLCNFVPIRTTIAYEVLARVPDRCGTPGPLGTVEADSGDSIPIPSASRPDAVVVARVHGLEPDGFLEHVGTLVYKASSRWVAFDSGRRYRLAPEVAGDGLIVSAPRSVDLPDPFRLTPDARTVTFSEDSGVLSAPNGLEVSFSEVPVEPRSRSGSGSGGELG